MKILRIIFASAAFLFVFLFIAVSAQCASTLNPAAVSFAASKQASPALRTSKLSSPALRTSRLSSPAKNLNQKNSYGKNLYRSMAKRRSNNRTDYPNLTDLEFANFRAVKTHGISQLYRSSSPVNPWGNRNVIADKAAETVGIRTFINLGDTEQKLAKYENFANSYCSTQKIILAGLDWKYQSAEFQRRLAACLSLMARAEPPFLIHCDLGKDRTGFVCAVLECLMGASAEEVIDDYMLSFRNYFGIMPNAADAEAQRAYDFIVNQEMHVTLIPAFGLKNIENMKNMKNVDLADAAEKYLLRIGVAPNDIKLLRKKLK